jgi:hypothetical protein
MSSWEYDSAVAEGETVIGGDGGGAGGGGGRSRLNVGIGIGMGFHRLTRAERDESESPMTEHVETARVR